MIRTVSYGGGVQSTALLVLTAQGKIDFPLFLFANTGDDSENPLTLAYVREIAAPYAAQHGIDLRDEQPELYERSVWLEQHVNRVREHIGKDRVYLTDAGAQRQQTLDQVIGTAEQLQLPMDTDSTCDLFSCMT